jgi:hypothetical protein
MEHTRKVIEVSIVLDGLFFLSYFPSFFFSFFISLLSFLFLSFFIIFLLISFPLSFVGFSSQELVEPGREFIAETNFEWLDKNGESSEIHCFLFNDLIVLARKARSKKNEYTYINHEKRSNASVSNQEGTGKKSPLVLSFFLSFFSCLSFFLFLQHSTSLFRHRRRVTHCDLPPLNTKRNGSIASNYDRNKCTNTDFSMRTNRVKRERERERE